MSKRNAVLAPAIALMLVLAACGARLTQEQRLAGIGSISKAGTIEGSGDGTIDGSGAGDGGSGTDGGTGASGPSGGDTSGGPGALPPPPAGGNGGATDIGVTANQITIATVSDVGGLQPGLFKSTHQAVSALAAMVNSQGGIYGRGLRPLLLDSRTNSSDNAAAVTDACDRAFAMVGSMSAFDDGGVSPGQKCGIPDISAITVNASRTLATNVFPAYAVRPDWFMIGTGYWIRDHFPEQIKHAGFIHLAAAVARQSSRQRIHAYEKLGFNFVYDKEIGLVEGNYNPFVQEMKEKGVQYLSYVGDYQSITRIQQEMEEEDYHPIIDLDSVAYSPKYLSDGGTAVNGTQVFLNTALLEEVSSNPEMQLYEKWLKRVAPGAVPDYFGLYAWSAGRLFVKVATDAGPKLTRKGLFTAIKAVHSWTDNGLHASNDIGNKLPTPCFLYVEVRNQKFVRKDPSSGWNCTHPLVKAS